MFSGQKGDSFVIQSFRVKLLNYLVQDTLGPLDPEYKGTQGNNHPSTQPHISVEMSLKYLRSYSLKCRKIKVVSKIH